MLTPHSIKTSCSFPIKLNLSNSYPPSSFNDYQTPSLFPIIKNTQKRFVMLIYFVVKQGQSLTSSSFHQTQFFKPLYKKVNWMYGRVLSPQTSPHASPLTDLSERTQPSNNTLLIFQ